MINKSSNHSSLRTLATSAAAAATSIVYLAHNGNSNSNWLAICNQFGDFCQKVSGAVVASFITVVSFMVLILLSSERRLLSLLNPDPLRISKRLLLYNNDDCTKVQRKNKKVRGSMVTCSHVGVALNSVAVEEQQQQYLILSYLSLLHTDDCSRTRNFWPFGMSV